MSLVGEGDECCWGRCCGREMDLVGRDFGEGDGGFRGRERGLVGGDVGVGRWVVLGKEMGDVGMEDG